MHSIFYPGFIRTATAVHDVTFADRARIGGTIAALCRGRGVDRAALASAARLPGVWVLELAEAGTGMLTGEELCRIARALRVPPGALFGEQQTTDSEDTRLARRIAALPPAARDRITLSLCELETEHERRTIA